MTKFRKYNPSAAIKIAQKKAKLSDADYRKLLFDLTGKNSSKNLTDNERKRVIKELNSLVNNQPKTPAEKKIWALWYSLRIFFPFTDRGAKKLYGICCQASNERIYTGLSDLSKQGKYKAIEALKQRIDFHENNVPF